MSTLEVIDKLYSKRPSMVLPPESDDVFVLDDQSEPKEPNTSGSASAVDDYLSSLDLGNPEPARQQKIAVGSLISRL